MGVDGEEDDGDGEVTGPDSCDGLAATYFGTDDPC